MSGWVSGVPIVAYTDAWRPVGVATHFQAARESLPAVLPVGLEFERQQKSHRSEAHCERFVLSALDFARGLVARLVDEGSRTRTPDLSQIEAVLNPVEDFPWSPEQKSPAVESPSRFGSQRSRESDRSLFSDQWLYLCRTVSTSTEHRLVLRTIITPLQRREIREKGVGWYLSSASASF